MEAREILSRFDKKKDGLVFIYLLSLADDGGNIADSMYSIAEDLEMPRNSLLKVINRLESKTFIKRSRERSHPNQKQCITICEYESYKTPETFTGTFTQRSQEKNTPFSPLESTPTPPKDYPPIIPQEKDTHYYAHEDFFEWLKAECPYIYGHLKLPSVEELERLYSRYGKGAVFRMCGQIENRADLRKRYVNLYRTLLTWLNRENEKQNEKNNRQSIREQERQQREREAAEVVDRLIATNKPVA